MHRSQIELMDLRFNVSELEHQVSELRERLYLAIGEMSDYSSVLAYLYDLEARHAHQQRFGQRLEMHAVMPHDMTIPQFPLFCAAFARAFGRGSNFREYARDLVATENSLLRKLVQRQEIIAGALAFAEYSYRAIQTKAEAILVYTETEKAHFVASQRVLARMHRMLQEQRRFRRPVTRGAAYIAGRLSELQELVLQQQRALERAFEVLSNVPDNENAAVHTAKAQLAALTIEFAGFKLDSDARITNIGAARRQNAAAVAKCAGLNKAFAELANENQDSAAESLFQVYTDADRMSAKQGILAVKNELRRLSASVDALDSQYARSEGVLSAVAGTLGL